MQHEVTKLLISQGKHLKPKNFTQKHILQLIFLPSEFICTRLFTKYPQEVNITDDKNLQT